MMYINFMAYKIVNKKENNYLCPKVIYFFNATR